MAIPMVAGFARIQPVNPSEFLRIQLPARRSCHTHELTPRWETAKRQRKTACRLQSPGRLGGSNSLDTLRGGHMLRDGPCCGTVHVVGRSMLWDGPCCGAVSRPPHTLSPQFPLTPTPYPTTTYKLPSIISAPKSTFIHKSQLPTHQRLTNYWTKRPAQNRPKRAFSCPHPA